MASIPAILGRHRWIEGVVHDKLRNERRPAVKCTNCAKTYDLARGESGIPVTGCISDVDLTRLGPSQQQDQLSRDMQHGLYQDTEH